LLKINIDYDRFVTFWVEVIVSLCLVVNDIIKRFLFTSAKEIFYGDFNMKKEDHYSFRGFFKISFNFFPALKCAFLRAGTFIEVFLKCNVYNDYLL